MQTLEVDGIPVIVRAPRGAPQQLWIHLHAFGQAKEDAISILDDMADRGFVAVSLDSWQHGARGKLSGEQLLAHVFGNFRRHMWPILGHTTLDVCRLIDWALAEFRLSGPVSVSGLSMGGDVAIAAAGLDARISRVFAVGSTPDWKRPGMRDVFDEDRIVPTGTADLYAQFFYDHLDPLTHVERYARGAELNFVSCESDQHIPPDGVKRFTALLAEQCPQASTQLSQVTLPHRSHTDLENLDVWWPSVIEKIRPITNTNSQK